MLALDNERFAGGSLFYSRFEETQIIPIFIQSICFVLALEWAYFAEWLEELKYF